VQRLYELAQIRVALAHLGVRTCTIRDKDVIFLAKDPAPVAAQMNRSLKSAASQLIPIRVLEPKDGSPYSEVYFRPPATSFEPDTLLAVLRHRLGVPGAADQSANQSRGPQAKPTRKVKFDL